MTTDNASAVLFPYFLDRQADGSWVVLNRNHKPLGLNTSQFVEYGDYPVAIRLNGLTPATLRALSCTDDASGDRIYLYRDECAPTTSPRAMVDYLRKLELLLTLED